MLQLIRSESGSGIVVICSGGIRCGVRFVTRMCVGVYGSKLGQLDVKVMSGTDLEERTKKQRDGPRRLGS